MNRLTGCMLTLTLGASVNLWGGTPLTDATFARDLQTMKKLILSDLKIAR